MASSNGDNHLPIPSLKLVASGKAGNFEQKLKKLTPLQIKRMRDSRHPLSTISTSSSSAQGFRPIFDKEETSSKKSSTEKCKLTQKLTHKLTEEFSNQRNESSQSEPDCVFLFDTQDDADKNQLSIKVENEGTFMLPVKPTENQTAIEFLSRGEVSGCGDNFGTQTMQNGKSFMDLGLKLAKIDNIKGIVFGTAKPQLVPALLNLEEFESGESTDSDIKLVIRNTVKTAFGEEILYSSPSGEFITNNPRERPPYLRLFKFRLEEAKINKITGLVNYKFRDMIYKNKKNEDCIKLSGKEFVVRKLVCQTIREQSHAKLLKLNKRLKENLPSHQVQLGYFPTKGKESSTTNKSRKKKVKTQELKEAFSEESTDFNGSSPQETNDLFEPKNYFHPEEHTIDIISSEAHKSTPQSNFHHEDVLDPFKRFPSQNSIRNRNSSVAITSIAGTSSPVLNAEDFLPDRSGVSGDSECALGEGSRGLISGGIKCSETSEELYSYSRDERGMDIAGTSFGISLPPRSTAPRYSAYTATQLVEKVSERAEEARSQSHICRVIKSSEGNEGLTLVNGCNPKKSSVIKVVPKQNNNSQNARSGHGNPKNELLLLGHDSFSQFITRNDTVLVCFFAPWWRYSEDIEPEFVKAAGELCKYNVTLAKVDASVEKKLVKENDIYKVPTYLVFRKGIPVTEYCGDNTSTGIVHFMLNFMKERNDEKKLKKSIKSSADESLKREVPNIKENNSGFVKRKKNDEVVDSVREMVPPSRREDVSPEGLEATCAEVVGSFGEVSASRGQVVAPLGEVVAPWGEVEASQEEVVVAQDMLEAFQGVEEAFRVVASPEEVESSREDDVASQALVRIMENEYGEYEFENYPATKDTTNIIGNVMESCDIMSIGESSQNSLDNVYNIPMLMHGEERLTEYEFQALYQVEKSIDI